MHLYPSLLKIWGYFQRDIYREIKEKAKLELGKIVTAKEKVRK